MTRAALEIRGLTVTLPKVAERAHAVQDVSLAVNRGEIVCLVGESGSGKSVIAHATMGLLPRALVPVAGEILVAGENTLAATPSRLRELRGARMAMIFQEPMTALNPVMRCGEQVDEVLATHMTLGPAQRRAKVRAMVDAVRLPDAERMIASYPHQLSGGQRQRIMIAMALALDPALLVADEPTTALDVTTQAQILALIRDLTREHGTGVLFITHDFGVVADIADRVVVLRKGEVVEAGPARDVLGAPREAYTRMLVAAVPSLTPKPRAPVDGPVVVQAEGLSKIYTRRSWLGQAGNPVQAAVDVSFTIRAGETVGIVGESGAGKSTVARCVARLTDPTAGRIVVAGADFATMSRAALHALRRRVQVVFQDPYRSLNPRRTVGAAIVEGPMNYGASRSEAMARARELMGLVRMDAQALDRYPHQFSGGQRQRICIARALAMSPDLLIADEAVSALDVSVQAQVLALLDEIRTRLNLAMLFVTHDLRVAAQICDRVAVMTRGRVVEYGPTAEIFANPKDDYTRSLIAAAPGRRFGFG